MVKDIYDIGIIGSGVAGISAALRLAENHKKIKCVLFELGRPVAKRRRFLEGYLGCFPSSDGKIYPGDIEQIAEVADGRRVNSMQKWFFNQIDEVNKTKLIKNKMPNVSTQKKFKEAGFDLKLHDYYQWKPDSIHQFSKESAERIEAGGNVEFSFDNEVFNILKQNGHFLVSSANGDYKCKKIILAVGRSGWRWVNDLYRKLGILVEDNISTFGIRIELSAQYLKDFNKSHCTMQRDDMILGPFSWGGQVIQEDHADVTVASFRSNEERWKSDKVFFSLYTHHEFPNQGIFQTDRLAKLGFLLSGDRVGREKIKAIFSGESQLSLIPEYQWLTKAVEETNELIPSIINRGYFHYPDIYSVTSNIRVAPNLETEIDGLFVAGESAGFKGLAAAGVSGAIAAESAVK